VDKAAAYHTLHTCLVTVAGLLAPFTPFLADRLWEDLVRSQDADAPLSVHLTDFPVARDDWRDEELRRAMATTRRVVELGRQARNDSGVRIRQPLGRALVTVPVAERDGLAPLLDDVADELNVKTVELSDGTGELVEHRLQPNFRALGPAFQKDAPGVAAAVTGTAPEQASRIAAELAAGGNARLDVEGRAVELTADMVKVVEIPRTGWELASEGATSFALDTSLTRDLEVEGAARELVRALNDQRKRLDLALDARVEVAVHVTPAELDGELADGGWYALVAREVLATTLHRRPEADAVAVELGELGEATVAVVTT
jgi:isoleucyl-tRNA synthetase